MTVASRRLISLLLVLVDIVSGLSRTVLSRRDAFRAAAIGTASTCASGTVIVLPSNAAYIDPKIDMPKITSRVFLDVDVTETGDRGRIVIGLFDELLPRTVDNFVKLAKENAYAGTTFYRVLSGMTLQGGAIGDETGKTGQAADGMPFEPDNYNVKHTRQGLVSMVRGVGGSADSRFFILTVDDGGWADDRYAAFGIVVEGLDLVHEIEKVKVKPPQNSPRAPVKIVRSGVL